MLGAVLTQDCPYPGPLLGAAGAKTQQQLALVVDRGIRDHPAHRESLEQELDCSLPGVLLGEQIAGECLRVFAPRGGAERPAQGQCVAVCIGVVAARGDQLLRTLAPARVSSLAALVPARAGSSAACPCAGSGAAGHRGGRDPVRLAGCLQQLAAYVARDRLRVSRPCRGGLHLRELADTLARL